MGRRDLPEAPPRIRQGQHGDPLPERYTRRNVGQIDAQITFTDPKAYVKPITVSIPMKLIADTEMLASVCENNAKSLQRMSATKPAQPVNVAVATRAKYVGVYDVVDEMTTEKSVVEISLSGTTLMFDYGGKGRESLVALSPTTPGFRRAATIPQITEAEKYMPRLGGC